MKRSSIGAYAAKLPQLWQQGHKQFKREKQFFQLLSIFPDEEKEIRILIGHYGLDFVRDIVMSTGQLPTRPIRPTKK